MADVTGGKDGLVFDNTYNKKGSPLVTVKDLKEIYLFGLNIKDSTGKPLPDQAYQTYIDNAVSMLEHYLDISISPVNDLVEFKDYRANDYWEYGYLQLNNFPVRSIKEMKLVYFKDGDGNPVDVQTIPNAWLRLQAHDGLVRMIPNTRFPTNLQVSQYGGFYPELLRHSMVPHAWQITYSFGFEPGCVPTLLNQAIATIAAIQALIVGGNLVLGAGIAGSSISIDGLSQTVQTTQSAENSAYSATIKDYGDKLWGKTKDDPFSMLRILHDYYKGSTMTII